MKRIILALSLLASTVQAQTLAGFTRATAPQVNDSTLFYVSIASPFRTRALTLGILKTFFSASTPDPLLLSNGTVSAPSHSFSGDATTGMYRVAGQLNFTVANGEIMRLTSGGIVRSMVTGFQAPDGSAGTPAYSFGGAATTGIYRNATNVNTSIAGTDKLGVSSTRVTALGVPLSVNSVGSASAPVIGLNSPATGMYFGSNGDTIHFANNGVLAMRIAGSGPATIIGGESSGLNMQAGTGNNRKMSFITTNGSGTNQTTMRLNEAGQILGLAGAQTTPTFTFTGDTLLGIYRGAANRLSIVSNNNAVANFQADTIYFLKPLSQNGIKGTTTNDNAGVGIIGEFMEHATVKASGLTLVSNTAKTIDSLTLTAGDWELRGTAGFNSLAASADLKGGFSTTTNAFGAQGTYMQCTAGTAGADIECAIQPVRFSLSATTKVYLVSLVNPTASTKGWGHMAARRIR